MGEEVRMSRYHSLAGGGDGLIAEDESVHEWEVGLPSADDLTPLSQTLIPPDLASAFSISPEPYRTLIDVNRASQNTVSTLRGGNSQAFSSNINNFKSFADDRPRDSMVVEGEEENLDFLGIDSRKLRKIEPVEEADSALRMENSADDPSGRSLKRPRLVWTPQLHKRFVDVVAHLGIKNAVPKTIMQLMNVEGLTRENVASHLQKYRLYLKRMQGLSNEGPSSSDPLFASTPAPQSSHESGSNGHGHGNGHLPPPVQIPMPYASQMMPMPVYGHMGVPIGNPAGAGGYHGGFESNYYMMQQRDWSGNNHGSVVSYPHVGPNEK